MSKCIWIISIKYCEQKYDISVIIGLILWIVFLCTVIMIINISIFYYKNWRYNIISFENKVLSIKNIEFTLIMCVIISTIRIIYLYILYFDLINNAILMSFLQELPWFIVNFLVVGQLFSNLKSFNNNNNNYKTIFIVQLFLSIITICLSLLSGYYFEITNYVLGYKITGIQFIIYGFSFIYFGILNIYCINLYNKSNLKKHIKNRYNNKKINFVIKLIIWNSIIGTIIWSPVWIGQGIMMIFIPYYYETHCIAFAHLWYYVGLLSGGLILIISSNISVIYRV